MLRNVPLVTFHGPNKNENMALWADVCRKSEMREQAWLKELRSIGVRAAHPDDGWVDRTGHYVRFTYPYFKEDNLKVGDLIALGWPDKYRIVTLRAYIGAAPLRGKAYAFTPTGYPKPLPKWLLWIISLYDSHGPERAA